MSADSQTLDLLRQAIQRGFINQQQAEQCIQFAAQNQRNALEVAQSYQLLSPTQIQSLLNPNPQASNAPQQARPGSQSGSASGSRGSDSGVRLPALGEAIDGYTIRRPLGQGGMGAVYEAEKSGTVFAIKFITSKDEKALERFEREAMAAAAVDSHPHIVRVHKYALWQDCPYVVMDYIQGPSLSDVIKENPSAYSVEAAFELMAKVADALRLVHKKGILHRDIKPANILIRESDGEPFLTDFGLAFVKDAKTLTNTTEVLGTPHYMAPEQASSNRDRLGPGTDIWALGVILYELLTGERPFNGQTLVEISAAILLKDPEFPSKKNTALSSSMDTVVLKCLEKDPESRYASADELRADCQAVFEGGPITASRSGLFGRARQRFLRKTGRLGAAVLLCSALVFVIAPILWFQFARQDRLDESKSTDLTSRFETLKKKGRELHSQFPDHFALHALRYRRETIEKVDKDPLSLSAKQYINDFNQFEQSALQTLNNKPEALEQLLGEKEWRRLKTQKGIMEILESEKLTPKSALKKASLSKTRRKLLLSFLDLKAGKLDAAAEGFEAVSQSVKNDSRLGQFGLAVLHARKGDFEQANALFQSLINVPELSARARQAFQEQSESGAMRALFSSDFDLDKTQAALLALDRYFSQSEKKSEEAWQQWNQRLQKRFKESPRDFKEDHKRRKDAYLKIRSLREKFPLLVKPKLFAETHKLLGFHFRTEQNTSEALYHFLQAQRQDETFDLPEGFRENDVAMLMVQTFVKKARNREKSLASLFDIILQASRARTYYPIVRGEWLTELNESGELAKAIAKYPNEPYPRFWRSGRDIDPNLSSQERRRQLQEMIADLDFVINHEKVPLHFRSMALRRRISRYFDLESPSKAKREEMKQDLKRLSEKWDPKPDAIWHSYIKVYGFSAGIPTIQSYLAKQRAWLKERMVRSQESRLAEGRPRGTALAPLFIDDYRQFYGDTLDIEANLFIFHGRFKEALKVLREQENRGDMRTENHRVVRLGQCLLQLKDADELQKYLEKYKDCKSRDFIKVKRMIRRFLKSQD